MAEKNETFMEFAAARSLKALQAGDGVYRDLERQVRLFIAERPAEGWKLFKRTVTETREESDWEATR